MPAETANPIRRAGSSGFFAHILKNFEKLKEDAPELLSNMESKNSAGIFERSPSLTARRCANFSGGKSPQKKPDSISTPANPASPSSRFFPESAIFSAQANFPRLKFKPSKIEENSASRASNRKSPSLIFSEHEPQNPHRMHMSKFWLLANFSTLSADAAQPMPETIAANSEPDISRLASAPSFARQPAFLKKAQAS